MRSMLHAKLAELGELEAHLQFFIAAGKMRDVAALGTLQFDEIVLRHKRQKMNGVTIPRDSRAVK